MQPSRIAAECLAFCRRFPAFKLAPGGRFTNGFSAPMATKTPASKNSAAAPKTRPDARSIDEYGSGSANGSKSAAPKVALPKDELLKQYRLMLLMRRFEERTGMEYRRGKIKGFCHLYIGQEAVAAGSIAALEPQDYIITAYRDHAHALARGISARECMAELYMKATGCSKGKGGSMHFFNGKTRMFGGHGIVGGQIPLATGIGWASRYRNDNAVTLCYFGDAAVNQGVFHESLNMASLWNLPVIYIVENNNVGMGTLVERSCAQTELYKRTADAYKIDGIRCNGMDFLEMYRVTKAAVDNARKNGRPTFIEAVTYRYRGHSMSDPATTYRNSDEVNQWETRDPLLNMSRAFPKIFTKDVLEKFEEEVMAEVEDAVKFAVDSPMPDRSEIWTDVYVDCQGYPKADASPNPREYKYDM